MQVYFMPISGALMSKVKQPKTDCSNCKLGQVQQAQSSGCIYLLDQRTVSPLDKGSSLCEHQRAGNRQAVTHADRACLGSKRMSALIGQPCKHSGVRLPGRVRRLSGSTHVMAPPRKLWPFCTTEQRAGLGA